MCVVTGIVRGAIIGDAMGVVAGIVMDVFLAVIAGANTSVVVVICFVNVR